MKMIIKMNQQEYVINYLIVVENQQEQMKNYCSVIARLQKDECQDELKALVGQIILINEDEIDSNNTVYNGTGTKLTLNKVPKLIFLK